MSVTIRLSLDSDKVMNELATIVEADGKTYYFMPYWFEKTAVPGVYYVHSLERKLPSKLIEAIKQNRK